MTAGQVSLALALERPVVWREGFALRSQRRTAMTGGRAHDSSAPSGRFTIPLVLSRCRMGSESSPLLLSDRGNIECQLTRDRELVREMEGRT